MCVLFPVGSLRPEAASGMLDNYLSMNELFVKERVNERIIAIKDHILLHAILKCKRALKTDSCQIRTPGGLQPANENILMVSNI